MTTVKITADNRISLIDIPWTLSGFYEAIEDCDCFETVNILPASANGWQIKMLADESGRLKGKPVNTAASFLYGITSHLQPIVGNVIFAEVEADDLVPPKEPEILMEILKETFEFLNGYQEE